MRWTPGRQSEDIEDRRGVSIRRAGPAIGIGGVAILLVLSLVTGRNFLAFLPDSQQVTTSDEPVRSSPEEDERVQFVSFVLDDTQQTWQRLLPGRYQRAKLVLFRDAVQSACGIAQAAMGPFYCPQDQKVYIDLGFYDELRERFGATGGDFAQAYVLAHELGHHVQNLLGIEPQVRRLQEQRPDLRNELSVKMELQADCFAGVWGYSTGQRGILEEGDAEDAMNAASAIGDDRIQRMGQGYVQPDSFTHGSSRQRKEWFRRGFEKGDPEACDTFGAAG
jgi:predicted metalloprotease